MVLSSFCQVYLLMKGVFMYEEKIKVLDENLTSLRKLKSEYEETVTEALENALKAQKGIDTINRLIDRNLELKAKFEKLSVIREDIANTLAGNV